MHVKPERLPELRDQSYQTVSFYIQIRDFYSGQRQRYQAKDSDSAQGAIQPRERSSPGSQLCRRIASCSGFNPGAGDGVGRPEA